MLGSQVTFAYRHEDYIVVRVVLIFLYMAINFNLLKTCLFLFIFYSLLLLYFIFIHHTTFLGDVFYLSYFCTYGDNLQPDEDLSLLFFFLLHSLLLLYFIVIHHTTFLGDVFLVVSFVVSIIVCFCDRFVLDIILVLLRIFIRDSMKITSLYVWLLFFYILR